MKNYGTISAEADQQCECCGRYHRTLYCIDGRWMGKNCKAGYEHYKIDSDINSFYWHGYETQYNKIKAMIENSRG
jgi:hypothetical protein